MGPVSLGPLQQTLAGAIQSALPGITLQYDKAAIEWDREQDRVNLVVLGTRILDQDGKVVASAPKADIDLAAAPFLSGKVAVQRITLVGVAFRLVHMKNGGIRLGAEGDQANDVYDRLNDVINAKGSTTSTPQKFRGARRQSGDFRRSHRPQPHRAARQSVHHRVEQRQSRHQLRRRRQCRRASRRM